MPDIIVANSNDTDTMNSLERGLSATSESELLYFLMVEKNTYRRFLFTHGSHDVYSSSEEVE